MKNLLPSFTVKLDSWKWRTNGLKKSLYYLSVDEKRKLVDPSDKKLSIRKQCELLRLHRSNIYYKPVMVSEETLRIMNHIDEIFTECPFYGSRRIREALRREGWTLGRERVQSLMRKMGLRAIYPKANLSKKHPNHKIYPYLLADMDIVRSNQVWSADITYIRLRQEFLYLVAIIDWFRRYVLSWRLSNPLATMSITYQLRAMSWLAPPVTNIWKKRRKEILNPQLATHKPLLAMNCQLSACSLLY